MMTIPEKSKRAEKSKQRPRRNWLLITVASVICMTMLASVALFFALVTATCACSPVDKTIAAIETSNALVATQLSETALAAVATDDMAKIAASAEAVQQTQTTEADHLIAGATTIALTLNNTIDNTAYVPLPYSVNATATAVRRDQDATAIRAHQSLVLTASAMSPSAPVTSLTPTQCGMFWTTDISVENTVKLQSALHDAGLDAVSGQMLIDSERDGCHVDASGTPFALSGIFQLQFTVAAGTAETSEARGALIERLLKVSSPVDYRGIQYIRVFFEPLDVRGNQWMMQYATALQSDKHGAALFEAGDY